MWGVVAGGLGVLFGLSVLIGHGLDRQARDAAWGRIATSRRINQETAQALQRKELDLQLLESELDRREQRVDLAEESLARREELLREIESQWRAERDRPAS